MWKEANVTLIFKKEDPSVVSNYRPISLLSAVGKVLEKIVHKHLFNFVRDHELLSALQSGFIPGDSTVNQLIDIYRITHSVNLLMKVKKFVQCFVTFPKLLTECGIKVFSLNLNLLAYPTPSYFVSVTI